MSNATRSVLQTETDSGGTDGGQDFLKR